MASTLSATRLVTERLVLRKAVGADRECLIDLQVDPQVRAHLGGPRPRRLVEQYLDARGVENATAQPGTFVVADKPSDAALGVVMVLRRSADRPGHVLDDGNELELSSVLRRASWGAGLAREAALAILHATAVELSDQPILFVTRQTNHRSIRLAERLGFVAVGTVEEHDARHALFVADLHAFRPRTPDDDPL